MLFTNILIGIFSSNILILISSVIGYNIEKGHEVVKYASLINCINLKLIPLYNLLRADSIKDKTLETTKMILRSNCDFLLQHIHLNTNKMSFIIPNSKIKKIKNDMDMMIYDLYVKLDLLNRSMWEVEFGIKSNEDWNVELLDFYKYIGNYQELDIFTNVLDKKHNEFIEVCKIKYKKDTTKS